MGGNTTVFNNVTRKEYSAEKVNLTSVSLPSLRKDFVDLFNTINEKFKREYGRNLWKPDDVKNSIVFNGSSSFVLNADYDEKEIIKYKPQMGDVDITIPDYEGKNLFLLLRKNENKRFGKFTYKGTYRQNENAIGDQILTVFRYYIDAKSHINIQVDFELTEFEKGSPTEFARFGHSSNFEDAKANVKAFHHKFIIQSVLTAISKLGDAIVVTKSSTPTNLKQVSWNKNKPAKLLKFSVTSGMRMCLEPMLDNGKQVYMDGLRVYKEIAVSDSKFEKSVQKIFNTAFRGNGDIKDFHSFVGCLRLIKKYCDKREQQDILEAYFNIMFALTSQVKEPTIEEDIELKDSGVRYAEKFLGIKVHRKAARIEAYKAHKNSKGFKAS